MRYSRNCYFKDVRKNFKDYEESLSLTASIPNDLIVQYAKYAWRLYYINQRTFSRALNVDIMLHTALKMKIDETLKDVSNFCETHKVKQMVI